MANRISTIREKLDELANVDRELKRYGASHHKYKHSPPIKDTELKQFESQIGISLPNEYRAFLTTLGGGGAGPGNGIYAFPNGGGGNQLLSMRNVHRPFPFVVPYRCWEHNDDHIELNDFDETCGTLRLSHYGCAIFAFLIVNGDHKNQIWFFEPNGGTFQPELDQAYPLPLGFPACQTPFTFFDWYENWLDISLYECETETNAENGEH